ncbi:hypothetical protein C0995_014277 [Termitomyces sp. Mi166|nr:hypothetical protein C0995_014277 [Termitomyces sp. Mi166\
MPTFWNKNKKLKREYRARARSFLEQTDLVIRGVNEEEPGPLSFRQLSSELSSSPPPSLPPPNLYPWSTQLLQPPPGVAKTISPFPRYNPAVLSRPTASGDVYLFGGLIFSNFLSNELYVISSFDTSPTVVLVQTRGDVPSGRVGHAMALMNDLLIVWGGDTKTNSSTLAKHQDDELYVMSTETHIWKRLPTVGPRPRPRYGHVAIVLGSCFVIFGGQLGPEFLNDIEYSEYLPAYTPAWVKIEPFGDVVPTPRTGHAAVEFQGQLFIFGGTDGLYHYNDVWVFDWGARLWSQLRCSGLIPAPREGHAATVVDDIMYIFGGRGTNGMDLDDLVAFVIFDQRWFAFRDMGPDAPLGRTGHKMLAVGARIYILGGEERLNPMAADPDRVHVLDTVA